MVTRHDPGLLGHQHVRVDTLRAGGVDADQAAVLVHIGARHEEDLGADGEARLQLDLHTATIVSSASPFELVKFHLRLVSYRFDYHVRLQWLSLTFIEPTGPSMPSMFMSPVAAILNFGRKPAAPLSTMATEGSTAHDTHHAVRESVTWWWSL